MHKYLIYTFFVIAILTGCDKEYFGTAQKQHLVTTCVLSPNSEQTLIVSITTNINDSVKKFPKIVEAKLYCEGLYVGSFDKLSNFRYVLKNYKPIENANYKLEIKADNYPLTAGYCKYPKSIKLDKIEFDTLDNQYNWGSGNAELKKVMNILFHDPAKVTNYYNIQFDGTSFYDSIFDKTRYIAFPRGTLLKTNIPDWFTIRDIFENFTDKYFDGREMSIKMGIDINPDFPQNIPGYIRVELQCLDENLYRNTVSKLEQSYKIYNEKDYYSEPMPIFGNFNNSLGVFGGYNVAPDSLPIKL